ncbi:MAG TPA: hypothetical protein VK427_26215 [Kofleriaceae bacterium]|nr:hypothetical protein [Kofleriaceae bacterium]
MRLAVLLVLAIGCGPIVYVNEVTRTAADRVDEARAAEADKYAPYHWTRAKEYYRKAKELAAHADFQAANRYGRLATEAAELAMQETAEAKKHPAPAKAPGPLAPAKESP